jgi:hypothetical protein
MGNSEDGKSIKIEKPSSPVTTVSMRIVYACVKHFYYACDSHVCSKNHPFNDTIFVHDQHVYCVRFPCF